MGSSHFLSRAHFRGVDRGALVENWAFVLVKVKNFVFGLTPVLVVDGRAPFGPEYRLSAIRGRLLNGLSVNC